MFRWSRWMQSKVSPERWYDWQERQMDRRYSQEKANLAGSDSRDDREALRFQYDTEREILHAEREARFTRKLALKARMLRVPLPSGDDYWRMGPFQEHRYLTREGVRLLRESMREEERWNIEKRKHWGSVVGAAAGLVGALTGLLAVVLTLR